MTLLKLKNAGDEATLEIASVEIVTGEFGQDVKFDTANGDTLYVPESSVLRQLDRTGVAEIADLSGKTLRFHRAENKKKGGKPFWDIDLARPGDLKPSGANGNGRPAAPPASAPKPKPIAAQQPDPPKPNPNAKTVPGGVDDSDYLDAIAGPGVSGKGTSNGSTNHSHGVSPAPTMADVVHSYGLCLATAVKQYAPFLKENGIDPTAGGCAAMAETLFIEKNKRGIV